MKKRTIDAITIDLLLEAARHKKIVVTIDPGFGSEEDVVDLWTELSAILKSIADLGFLERRRRLKHACRLVDDRKAIALTRSILTQTTQQSRQFTEQAIANWISGEPGRPGDLLGVFRTMKAVESDDYIRLKAEEMTRKLGSFPSIAALEAVTSVISWLIEFEVTGAPAAVLQGRSGCRADLRVSVPGRHRRAFSVR